jgi:hypothetical protein
MPAAVFNCYMMYVRPTTADARTLDCKARYHWTSSVFLFDVAAVTLYSDLGSFAIHGCSRVFVAIGAVL